MYKHLVALLLLFVCMASRVPADPVAVLKNAQLQAEFSRGSLVKLTSPYNGQSLMHLDSSRPGPVSPFIHETQEGHVSNPSAVDASVKVTHTQHRVKATYRWPDGTRLVYDWSLEKQGDLVLRARGYTPRASDVFRISFTACDLAKHRLVYVTNFGVGQIVQAPFNGSIVGDAGTFPDGTPVRKRCVMPLLTLFEGEGSGFVLEGRDVRVGPSIVNLHGTGNHVNVEFVKYTAQPVKHHRMYEIRLRAYRGSWHQAVDPYVDWMQTGLGFVPLSKKSPAWVRDLYGQVYHDPHWSPLEAAASLDDLAKSVNPAQTLLGKISEYRLPKWGFDHGWGDYSFTDEVRQFFVRARQLGFHTAAHLNVSGIDLKLPDLVAKFKPGLQESGSDADGNPKYMGYNGEWSNAYGPVAFAWCSPAYKPYRDHIIRQLRPLVTAGVDIVYLDESHTPLGRFDVDGMTAIEGVMQLQRDILKAFPNVAIMTEQFNPMCSRYASFALTSHDLGHPLSGYLYRKFIKVASWHGVSADGGSTAYWRWGGNRLHGAAGLGDVWPDIAGAFAKYKLEPAYEYPLASNQLSAYSGADGIKAFYEMEPNREGLAVYINGNKQVWCGLKDTPTSSPE